MTDPQKIEDFRKKLIFRAAHRGTKEMDIVMGEFAKRHVPDFTPEQLDLFAELLNWPDPDIYNWITGQEEVPANIRNHVTDLLLAFKVV